MTVHKEHTSGTPLYTPSWWYTLGKFWYTLGCTIHPVDKHWARTFILLLLSIILVKSFFSSVKTHDLLYQRQQLYYVRHAPCLWNYLPEDQLNFQSLWKVCYFLPYDVLFWKLEQWIEREFVHFVYSSLAIRECTKWAHGLSIHCSSFQSAFLCYFKHIDSFFMCLIVFVLADFFCATIITGLFLCYHKKWHWTLPIEPK